MTAGTGIVERLARVRAELATAARAAGRSPDSVRLVAVAKHHPVEAVLAAAEAGQRDFGENVVQDLALKATAAGARRDDLRWHFLGRLQKNKINLLLRHRPVLVHSVDSIELGAALAQRVEGDPLGVLVQVNIGREPQKGGVAPEQAIELARALALLPKLSVRGFMGIPPQDVPPRPHFEALARLRDDAVRQDGLETARELSMGMTHDYADAVACGATLVRVGTAIFGERAARDA